MCARTEVFEFWTSKSFDNFRTLWAPYTPLWSWSWNFQLETVWRWKEANRFRSLRWHVYGIDWPKAMCVASTILSDSSSRVWQVADPNSLNHFLWFTGLSTKLFLGSEVTDPLLPREIKWNLSRDNLFHRFSFQRFLMFRISSSHHLITQHLTIELKKRLKISSDSSNGRDETHVMKVMHSLRIIMNASDQWLRGPPDIWQRDRWVFSRNALTKGISKKKDYSETDQTLNLQSETTSEPKSSNSERRKSF